MNDEKIVLIARLKVKADPAVLIASVFPLMTGIAALYDYFNRHSNNAASHQMKITE